MPPASCCAAAAELNGAHKTIHDLYTEIDVLEMRLAHLETDNRYLKELSRLNEADNAILNDLKDELQHFISLYQPVAANAATSLRTQLDALHEIRTTGVALDIGNAPNDDVARRPPDIITERECWKCRESERRMAYAEGVRKVSKYGVEEKKTKVARWISDHSEGRRAAKEDTLQQLEKLTID